MLITSPYPVRRHGVQAKQTDSMADNNQPIEWYLARDGQQHGPVTDAELRKIIELGYLKPTDLVWRSGMAEWALAETVLSLAPPPAKPSLQAPDARLAGAHPAQPVRVDPEPASPHRFASAQPAAGGAHVDSRGRFEGGPDRAHGPAPHPQGPANAAEARPQPQGGVGYSAAPRHPQAGVGPRSDPRLQHEPQVGTGGYAGGAGRQQPAPAPVSRAEPRHAAGAPGPIANDERRGFPWRTAIILAMLAGLGAGGFALHATGRLTNLPFLAAPLSTDSLPVIRPPASPARDEPRADAAGAAASPTAPPIEANLQKSPLWRVLKRDFPDWYQERVAEVTKLASESKTDREINATLLRTVVELRRRHHPEALAASPERLKSMAASFVDNLTRLSRESTAACYGYISQGEASPALADLGNPEQQAAIEAQLATIFDAVADGRKAPTRREPPRREDYDILTAELGKRGWSPADLQLFTDARALSRAAPDKVCKMVQDWFAAQLAVGDEAAKIRLLGEALKPVVAG